MNNHSSYNTGFNTFFCRKLFPYINHDSTNQSNKFKQLQGCTSVSRRNLFKKCSYKKRICEDLGTQQGKFKDWVAAKQGCGAGGQGDDYLTNQADDDKTKKKMDITKNINIVWSALVNSKILGTDNELTEFFMTLSGTVIFDNSTPTKITIWPSMALANGELIKAILQRGETTIYVCNKNTHYLIINQQKINISTKQALKAQVSTILQNIAEKVKIDTPFYQCLHTNYSGSPL